MHFCNQGHDKETPQQCFERKFKLNRRLHPLPNVPTEHHYSNEVVIVWDHVPTSWHTHIDINECGDIARLLKEAGNKQRALLAANTSDLARLVQAKVAKVTKHAQYTLGRCLYHHTQMAKEVGDVEEAPVDVPALVVSPATAQSGGTNRLFAYPQSDNTSKRTPPRPCRHCGSPTHYNNNCASWKKARPAASTAKLHRPPRTQAAYQALYDTMIARNKDEYKKQFSVFCAEEGDTLPVFMVAEEPELYPSLQAL
jgi:hypothetical protein